MSFFSAAKQSLGNSLIKLGTSMAQNSQGPVDDSSLSQLENLLPPLQILTARAAMAAMNMSNDTSMSGMNMTNSTTSMSGMNMSNSTTSMSGMNMTNTTTTAKASSCKLSMYWNWYTIDACFITKHWHITSKHMFVGSIFGIIFMMMALELVRRGQREFDRWCVRRFSPASNSCCHSGAPVHSGPSMALRIFLHFLRSCFYLVQYIVAYIAMLLAMYYNGYVILFLFCGTFFGYFLFGADTISTKASSSVQTKTIVQVADEKHEHDSSQYSDTTPTTE
ncbi:Copper transport protein ctr4 [Schizosaccharomyces pombe]